MIHFVHLPRLLGLSLMLCSMVASFARAETPASESAPTRVLPPSAGEAVMAAFKRAGPTWRLEAAQIDRDVVNGTTCLGEGSARCLPFRLSDVKGCAAVPAGPWCLTIDVSNEGARELPILVAALAETSSDVWIDLGRDRLLSDIRALASRLFPWLKVIPVAIAWFLVPGLIGLGLGRLIRRWRGGWPLWSRFSGGLVLMVAVVALLPHVPFGLWDMVGFGTVTASTFVWCAAPPRRNGAAGRLLMAATFVVGLIGLELLVRAVLAEPPVYPLGTDARLLFSPEDDDSLALSLRAAPQQSWLTSRRETPLGTGERVLHLGDSMVWGTGVSPAETFASQLETLDPGVTHVNAGVPGIGLDGYLMLERVWLDVVKPARVVVHVFPGNDFHEVDRSSSYCEAGPLFDYDGPNVRQRCTAPRWKYTILSRFRNAAAPYPLRVATSFSWAARHGVNAFSSFSLEILVRFFAGEGQRSEETVYAHNEALLRALRDDLSARNIPLTVAIVPYREALKTQHPESLEQSRYRTHFATMASKLGLPVVDSWSDFQSLVKADGTTNRLFLTPPDWEVHFTAEGNRSYAQWLLRELGPGLRGRPHLAAPQIP